MNRRAALLLLIGQARLGMLWLRMRIGRPLPVALMLVLRTLDRWALRWQERGR